MLTGQATSLGLGAHVEALPIQARSSLLKVRWDSCLANISSMLNFKMQLIFISSLGYHVTLMLLKSAFILQFRRVFPLPTFQRVCDIFLGFLAVWTVVGIVGGVTVCLPLSKTLDPREPTWSCDKRFWFWMSHGIVHVITDVLIFVMPLPLLRTLPLPPLHKIALTAVFCLGFLYVGSSLNELWKDWLTFEQDLRDIRLANHYASAISPGPRFQLDLGKDSLLVSRRGNVLDRVPLHTYPPSAFRKLLCPAGGGSERDGKRDTSVCLLCS